MEEKETKNKTLAYRVGEIIAYTIIICFIALIIAITYKAITMIIF